MAAAKSIESSQTRLRANEAKWGEKLVAAGWTMIPSTILERQEALGLDPVDMNILLQLARYWWRADNPPHPAIRSIAQCIKKSVSTVQRRIKSMERKGLIQIEHRHDPKHGGQMSSNYRFTGLIEAATQYATEAIEEKEANKERKSARLKRKVPLPKTNLKVVNSSE